MVYVSWPTFMLEFMWSHVKFVVIQRFWILVKYSLTIHLWTAISDRFPAKKWR